MAMDGRYAGNAGAISGYGHGWPVCRKCRSNFRRWPWMAGMPEMQEQFPAMAMEGRYAKNAGAIFGYGRSRRPIAGFEISAKSIPNPNPAMCVHHATAP